MVSSRIIEALGELAEATSSILEYALPEDEIERVRKALENLNEAIYAKNP